MVNPISNFFQQQLTTDTQELFDFQVDSLTAQKSLQDIVIEFFQRENWEFTSNQNPSILRMACQGENGQWRCYAKVQEAEQQFAFYSICPLQTPPEKLAVVAEFIARANYGTIIGNFELDFDDGEIRYKTSIDAQKNQLNLGSISRLVCTNVSMMDCYLPGILAVIEQDLEPSKAIQAIES